MQSRLFGRDPSGSARAYSRQDGLKVDLRTVTMDAPPQDVITRDNVRALAILRPRAPSGDAYGRTSPQELREEGTGHTPHPRGAVRRVAVRRVALLDVLDSAASIWTLICSRVSVVYIWVR